MDELLELERKFWTAGPEFYRAHVDDACLLAFEQMIAVLGRQEVARTVSTGPRWRDLRIDLKAAHQPTSRMVFLSYEARARREGETYHALISSAYQRRQDGWKLTFHTQAPLPDG